MAEKYQPGKFERAPTVGKYDVAMYSGEHRVTYADHILTSKNPADRMIVDPFRGFLGIFDGMSEHRHGAQAAEIAADIFTQQFGMVRSVTSPEQAINLLETASSSLQTSLKDQEENRDRDLGTTALVAQIVTNEVGIPTDIVVGNAGRSRLYLVHEDGSISRLTHDHNYQDERGRPAENRFVRSDLEPVEPKEIESIDMGEGEEPWKLDLSFMDIKRITNYFDGSECRMEYAQHSLNGARAIIATSDAVSDYYPDEELLAQTIDGAKDATAMAEKIIEGTKNSDIFPHALDDQSVVVLTLPHS